MPKLSIIIPCYNAANYIDCCFQSLEHQTIGIKHLEIIFVNDASTDNTQELLMDFEKKYPDNVIVINCEQNGRQGAARNIGLRYATAEYVGFADDDDMFAPEMFEDLYQKAVTYQCDMVMCDFDTVNVDDCRDVKLSPHPSADDKKSDALYEIATPEERIAFITADPVRCIWNKIYRRSILASNDIRFPEGYIYDDIYFYELVKHYVRRVYKRNRIYYHHIFRAKSASIDRDRKDDMLGYLDVQLMLVEELKHRGIYNTHRESYDEMLMLEAIGLIKTYLIRYGEVEYDVLLAIKEKLLPYREAFLTNTLLQRIWQADDSDIDKRIAQTLL